MLVALPAGAFTGLVDLSGRLLDLYRLRRDGSFFDQQRFLSALREEEAARAEDRWTAREEFSARIRAGEAARNYRLEVERDWRQARINVVTKNLLDRQDRLLEQSPLALAPEDARQAVSTVSDAGRRPVLLIAPFYQEHLGGKAVDDAPHAFRVALRRGWLDVPWQDDFALLDGVISRPLRNTDLDMLMIQRALRDLPVVLVCGEVQAGRRVWLSLLAWNVVPAADAPAIHLAFPSMPLPPVDGPDDPGAARLAFEDQLGQLVAITAGMLGEWFHLVRDGRAPRLHSMLPRALDGERRIAAASAAAAYEVALQHGRVDRLMARVGQATTYAAAGLADRASALGREALRELAGARGPLSAGQLGLLRELVGALTTAGNAEACDEARGMLERAARGAVLDSLGMEGEETL